MKRVLIAAFVLVSVVACNNENKGDEAEMKDPQSVQPVSDALPDSTKLPVSISSLLLSTELYRITIIQQAFILLSFVRPLYSFSGFIR